MKQVSAFITQMSVAIQNKKIMVKVKRCRFLLGILWLLYKEGFIAGYTIVEREIVIYLKYYKGTNTLSKVKQISKISRRYYITHKNLFVENRYVLHNVVTVDKGLFITNNVGKVKLPRGGELLFKIQ